MGLTTTAKNTMLDALTITHVSLHTTDPGATGTNEVTGGSYARKAITMAASSGGSRSASTQPVFDVPAGTVAYVGFWNNTTFLGSDDLTTEVYAAPGTYTLTSATITVS